MDNKFTLTFGQSPISYIDRGYIAEQIYDFSLDFPLSNIYIISGVRGSGKTVLLTNISKMILKKKDWIVVDVNPNREILEQVAAGIYENVNVKHLFASKTFSFFISRAHLLDIELEQSSGANDYSLEELDSSLKKIIS